MINSTNPETSYTAKTISDHILTELNEKIHTCTAHTISIYTHTLQTLRKFIITSQAITHHVQPQMEMTLNISIIEKLNSIINVRLADTDKQSAKVLDELQGLKDFFQNLIMCDASLLKKNIIAIQAQFDKALSAIPKSTITLKTNSNFSTQLLRFISAKISQFLQQHYLQSTSQAFTFPANNQANGKQDYPTEQFNPLFKELFTARTHINPAQQGAFNVFMSLLVNIQAIATDPTLSNQEKLQHFIHSLEKCLSHPDGEFMLGFQRLLDNLLVDISGFLTSYQQDSVFTLHDKWLSFNNSHKKHAMLQVIQQPTVNKYFSHNS